MGTSAIITAVCTVLAVILAPALSGGRGSAAPAPEGEWPDSLRSLYLYTEGIKQRTIAGDTARSRALLREAIRLDSTYAPAYYELVANEGCPSPDEAVRMARRAHETDTLNKWYLTAYGQSLLFARRYDEALGLFRTLCRRVPDEPNNWRILAALYEMRQQPFSAIATLDSAEVRFGRIPLLGSMKRQLLLRTRQYDKAEAEARAEVDAAPYEAEPHVALGETYSLTGKDSLAQVEFLRALEIEPTNTSALMSLSDHYNSRRDYRNMLSVTRRLFESDALPVDEQVRRFGQFTSDVRFYREYFFPIDDLARLMVLRHPDDRRIIGLYAKHLIASGELEQALALYKQHADGTPPETSFFHSIIEIESYLQRSDSVQRYVDRAIALFPAEAEFHIAKGHALCYAKEYDRGIATYRESLRHVTTDSLRSVVWGFIGDAFHQKADRQLIDGEESFKQLPKGARKAMDACYKAYDKSLAYDADNASVLNNYAYFLSLEERDLERALTMATRAVALSDNNPTYLDTNAWVLFRLGRLDEAKKLMRQAIALDSRGSTELMVHYGDILNALGERFMAESYWRKALEKGYDAEAIERRLQRKEEQR